MCTVKLSRCSAKENLTDFLFINFCITKHNLHRPLRLSFMTLDSYVVPELCRGLFNLHAKLLCRQSNTCQVKAECTLKRHYTDGKCKSASWYLCCAGDLRIGNNLWGTLEGVWCRVDTSKRASSAQRLQDPQATYIWDVGRHWPWGVWSHHQGALVCNLLETESAIWTQVPDGLQIRCGPHLVRPEVFFFETSSELFCKSACKGSYRQESHSDCWRFAPYWMPSIIRNPPTCLLPFLSTKHCQKFVYMFTKRLNSEFRQTRSQGSIVSIFWLQAWYAY